MTEITADDVKKKADIWELAGINFLNDEGKFARSQDECTTVELIFIDGDKLTVTPAEMQKLDDYNFKLRPTELDS